MPKVATDFVFIDESGNFDFSSNGTNHFVMTCVAALSPLDSAASLDGLKYQLLAEGIDVSSFHLFGSAIIKFAIKAYAADNYKQIADYICWAKYVALERNELRPWAALQNSLRPTDFHIFRNGHTWYY